MVKLKAAKPTISHAPVTLKAPPKLADEFYRSPEWRRLVREIKAERGSWCQRCGSGHRIIADHIKELKDGGARLDRSNIELLCQSCHNKKTAASRAARFGERA